MSAPLIFCDLIEEPFGSYEDYRSRFLATADDLDEGSSSRYTDAEIKALYDEDRAAHQPWRILVLSGDNHEPLFRSTERYKDERDARHAIELAFGAGSNVYLRAAEKGNELLRLAAE